MSPYSLFTGVELYNNKTKAKVAVAKKEPFELIVDTREEDVSLNLHFQGHYLEPPFSLDIDLKSIKESKEHI